MQSGELIVTGKDSIRILLHGYPREITVRFKHDHHPVPCNPNDADWLEYEVVHEDEDPRLHAHPGHHHHDRQFYLSIKWDVSGVREIVWFVE